MVQTGRPIDRRSVTVALIRELNRHGSWSGSTHVQKCVFFLQHLYGVDLGYPFVIYHYGPYSFELEEELALGRWQGWVNVEPDPSGYGVHYKPGAIGGDDGPELPEAHRRAIGDVVEHLGCRRVRELELLATAYFFQKGLDGRDRTDRDVVEAVVALKPHFTQDEVREALRELAEVEQKRNRRCP
ncbi:MAG: hypothetical protein H0Z37_01985 [Firmicutes bacterium]|nr:hypothetical protein [Bacillota bacterium]